MLIGWESKRSAHTSKAKSKEYGIDRAITSKSRIVDSNDHSCGIDDIGEKNATSSAYTLAQRGLLGFNLVRWRYPIRNHVCVTGVGDRLLTHLPRITELDEFLRKYWDLCKRL